MLAIASVATFWISFLFTPAVSLIWPWWRSDWGWNIVLLESCVWVSLAPAPLHVMFGVPYGPFLAWFQVAAVFGTGAVILWRAFMIWRTQAVGRDEGT
jgi:hypothetical protein